MEYRKGIRRLALSAVLALPALADADDRVREADQAMYPPDARYDARIPEPEQFLGHALGRAPVRHHRLVDYIETVADMSERMTAEVIGYSHERRPILTLTITSPQNHSRIAGIRLAHLALGEPGSGQAVSPDMPLVIWLNYGVHGAEASGMDAALPMVYHLAAAEGPAIERMLAESVILLTAVFNPDGHAKRVHWFDSFGGVVPVADPQHIEHDYDKLFLRTNHYGFDLNRQWLLLTQPEPRAWVAKWHDWRPNVTVDYHEMGSDRTYYFHPGIATRTHPLVPAEAEQIMADTVRESERFLDRESRLYFHGEGYDNFYPGKGSTYPLFNGSIGILYEAGSARGVEIETPYGLRTYRENIRKHFRTGISSVEGALNQRERLLDYQRRFYASAIEEADDALVKAYVFDAPGDAARLYHFVDLLHAHRIRSYELARDITLNGKSFAAGQAMIVPLRQAQHRMIRGIFDTQTEFADTTFYDVSAWTLPLAYNLHYEPLSGRNFRDNLLGIASSLEMPVADPPEAASYAYAFEWSGYYAPRALGRILGEGLLANVATEPFAAQTARGAQHLGRGSIVVPFDRQERSPAEIGALMHVIAAEDGVTVHAITSGRSASGSAEVGPGGPSILPVTEPKVLLITGRDVDRYNSGSVWHLIDFRMRMPVTLRDRELLADLDWRPYTHVIFPGGEYEEYLPEYLGALRRWVEGGGTVIGMREASLWLKSQVLDYVEPLPGETPPAAVTATTASGHDPLLAPDAEPERHDYGQKTDRDATRLISGAIFHGDLDNTHPLGFGFDRREVALLKNMAEVLTHPPNPYATVIVYDRPPLLSGYASPENQEALAGSAALIADRRGEGSIILFADDPTFRGTWLGTDKLLMNSLFFSKAFQPYEE
ncbi:MAG: M14 family zinc carboxypeptidase [Woeseiaceae bacterium]